VKGLAKDVGLWGVSTTLKAHTLVDIYHVQPVLYKTKFLLHANFNFFFSRLWLDYVNSLVIIIFACYLFLEK